MTTPQLPAIPDIDANNVASVQAALGSIKELLEILIKRRGTNTDNQAVLYGDSIIDSLRADIAGKVSDEAYNATSWNAVVDIAPSKNAVRDKVVSIDADIAGKAASGANADITSMTSLDDGGIPFSKVADLWVHFAKGYILGGYTDANTAVIEDLIFSSETSQAIAATLDTAKRNGAGVNSSTKGYILGGYTTAVTAVIEDLIFSSETSQPIAATLDTAKKYGAGVNSSTKGYILGGCTTAVIAVIEDLIFSSETSQAIAATLNTAKQQGVGVNSSTKGYILGGYTNASTTIIEDLIFSNETSQAIAAALDTGKREGAGVQYGYI